MICLQFFQDLFVLIWQVKCSIIPTLYFIRETLSNPIIVQTEINSNLTNSQQFQLQVIFSLKLKLQITPVIVMKYNSSSEQQL